CSYHVFILSFLLSSTVCFLLLHCFYSFFIKYTATTETYTLSLHDALPIFLGQLPLGRLVALVMLRVARDQRRMAADLLEQRQQRSEEHTSELQSRENLVCRLLLEKKKYNFYLN